jgi:hypothetical protein
MALIPLSIPPGVYRSGTELQSAGRWYDVNLVRWTEGSMEPVGGWERRGSGTLTGKCRGLLTWKTNSNVRFAALGTSSKLYVMTQSSALVDITPTGFTAGSDDASTGAGFGIGNYSAGYYGTPRPDSGSVTPATTWSLDTWGEYLVGCSTSDGKLYEWQLDFTTPTKAAAITNAPTNCIGLLVTAERSLFALGASGDGRKVAWSDLENNTIWTPASTNLAGSIELQTTGRIVTAKRVRGQNLILTDIDAHTLTYVGQPFVYQAEIAGRACGAVSANCAAVLDNLCVWMGARGFHIFDGYVKPLQCDVYDYIFNNINTNQISKVYAVNNAQFNEVWWFYPSANSNENDSYVAWDYVENHWTIGTLARTAGTDRSVFRNPIMIGANGYIYDHEVGLNYDSGTPYAESGPVQIGNGDNIMYVNEMIPDERNQGGVTATFKTRYYPNGSEESYGPYSLTNPTSVRFNGRQVKMRVTTTTPATSWRVGTQRLNAVAGGRR